MMLAADISTTHAEATFRVKVTLDSEDGFHITIMCYPV